MLLLVKMKLIKIKWNKVLCSVAHYGIELLCAALCGRVWSYMDLCVLVWFYVAMCGLVLCNIVALYRLFSWSYIEIYLVLLHQKEQIFYQIHYTHKYQERS